MLLKNGAIAHVQGGEYSNALQAASIKGYKEIVEILLKKAVKVNA